MEIHRHSWWMSMDCLATHGLPNGNRGYSNIAGNSTECWMPICSWKRRLFGRTFMFKTKRIVRWIRPGKFTLDTPRIMDFSNIALFLVSTLNFWGAKWIRQNGQWGNTCSWRAIQVHKPHLGLETLHQGCWIILNIDSVSSFTKKLFKTK